MDGRRDPTRPGPEARRICFLEHRKSKMPKKNDTFYLLFGAPQIKNGKRRQVLHAFLEHRQHHRRRHAMKPPYEFT